jgi:hypothetical protein
MKQFMSSVVSHFFYKTNFNSKQCIGSADTLIVTVRKSFFLMVLVFSQIWFFKIYSILHGLFQPDTLTSSSFPTTTMFSDIVYYN